MTKRGDAGSHGLGVQFGSSSVRVVAVERHRRGFRLHHCCESTFPDGVRFQGQFDPASKAACIRALRTLLDTVGSVPGTATIGLDSRGVLVKRVPVDPWLEEEELQQQMWWEAEQLLVEPLDQFVIDYDIQDINETRREAVLAVVRKKILEDYSEIAEKGGLDPVCMDVDLFALGNAFEHMGGGRMDGRTALVDIEPDCVRLVLMDHGVFCFGRSQTASSPSQEVEDLLQAALRHCPATGLEKIVVAGEQTLGAALIQELSARYASVESASPFQDVKMGPSVKHEQIRDQAIAFMIGYGLALRGVTES